MPIAAKPAAPYTVNTGHAQCPDHLYMMDEAAGTTLVDKGKAATKYNLTLAATTGAGPDWVTDGTHGPALDFVAANEDKIYTNSVSGLSGTQVLALLVNAAVGTVQRTFLGLSDSTQLDRIVAAVYQGDEDLETIVRFDDVQQTNTSTQALNHGSWDLVMLRANDTAYDWSLNGSAWAAGSHSHAGMIAAMNSFFIGFKNITSPAAFLDETVTAAFWYHGDKDPSLVYAAISGASWAFLSTTTKKVKVSVHPSAASASGCSGVVFATSAGIAGTEIGEFTGKTFEVATEGTGVNERAILKIPVDDFGGGSLTAGDTVGVYVRNTLYDTGIISATVIEE